MAVVAVRGACGSAMAGGVIEDALVAGIVFAAVGGITGWILDYVITDHIRRQFEQRLDWYHRSMADRESAAGHDDGQLSASPTQP